MSTIQSGDFRSLPATCSDDQNMRAPENDLKLTIITGNNGLTSLLLIMEFDAAQWDMPADMETINVPTCATMTRRKRRPSTG